VTKIRNQKAITELGKKIKSLRKEKGLSIYALANLADIERSQILRIEDGTTNTTVSTLLAIAGALEVKPKELFDF
jgi:transcriptional regulator with XRE-family HTH domain